MTHEDHEAMKESTARRQDAKHDPDVYFFEGDTVRAVYVALGKASSAKDARLYFRLGRKADGSPEAWVEVRAGGEAIGTYNVSQTCPPRPPEECV
jgi:hypothetical protein